MALPIDTYNRLMLFLIANIVTLYPPTVYAALNPLYLLVESPASLHYTYEIQPSSQIGAPLPRYTSYDLPLVLAEPINACTKLKISLQQDKAVLVDRGECTFLTKLMNVQEAGGLLAIATDTKMIDNTQSLLIDMADDASGRAASIPGVFVSGVSGRKWVRYLRAHNEMTITVPLNYSMFTVHRARQPLPPWELW